jgi:hypothetical protein
MTKAKTMQASKKLRKRWPCQNRRTSFVGTATGALVVLLLLASFQFSMNSVSPVPITFRAVDPHISHVLFQQSEDKDERVKMNTSHHMDKFVRLIFNK